MQLLYWIAYGLLYAFSLLPLRVLHLVSDLLWLITYHWVRYRRQVVEENLATAFPEKSQQERNAIAKKFYRNFTDTLVESVKMISASERLVDRMFQADMAVFEKLYKTKKNIQIHAMHNFNWEVVNLGVSRKIKLPFLGVYQPIINPFFEQVFRKIRSRYGTVLIPANDFKNNFLPHKDSHYILALVADQNPGHPAKAWWVNFFGKPAPFVMGPEKAARSRDNIVVFGNFFKLRRGVYSFEIEEVSDDLHSMKEGELTLRYIQYLERCIRARPDNYLWSHRRWKHPYKDDYASLVLEPLQHQA
jgi:Kdo2-lipid IVA lauroyltransferase/acyltransferase